MDLGERHTWRRPHASRTPHMASILSDKNTARHTYTHTSTRRDGQRDDSDSASSCWPTRWCRRVRAMVPWLSSRHDTMAAVKPLGPLSQVLQQQQPRTRFWAQHQPGRLVVPRVPFFSLVSYEPLIAPLLQGSEKNSMQGFEKQDNTTGPALPNDWASILHPPICLTPLLTQHYRKLDAENLSGWESCARTAHRRNAASCTSRRSAGATGAEGMQLSLQGRRVASRPRGAVGVVGGGLMLRSFCWEGPGERGE